MAVAFETASTPQGFTGSITWTMNAPSGVASGDTLIGVFGRSNTSRVISSYPSGWSQLEQIDETVQVARFIVAYKIAGGSEPGTYDFTWDASAGQGLGVLLRYSGGDGATPDAASQANAADETPPTPTVVPTVDGSMIVGVIGVDITAGSTHPHFTPPSGWTERIDANETVDYTCISVADFIQTTAASITADFGQPVGEGFASATMAVVIAPAGGGGGSPVTQLFVTRRRIIRVR